MAGDQIFFSISMFKRPFLLSSLQDTREYKWTDGWPLSFTTWGENEPSGEGCVAMNTDEVWDDEDCDMMKGFICKYTLGNKV